MIIALKLSLSQGAVPALTSGIRFRMVVGGVVYERLRSSAGEFLFSSDGTPLYGRSK